MSEFVTQWGPVLIAVAIVWASYQHIQIVHAANIDRREDHKELMRALEDIKNDLAKIEAAADGLSRRYDPPDLSDYD